jgi:hypothetical protein
MESRFLRKEYITSPKIMEALGGAGIYTLLMVQPNRRLGNRNDTSVHPAWRDADVYATGFKIPAVANFDSLRRFAPDTGAYGNEAHWQEPNWQQAFWGSNYPKLAEIKTKVDPTGLFWTSPGVNAEQ